MFHPSVLIAIAIGGSLGAITRYIISHGAKSLFGEGFPYGTLIVNVVGCLILGLVAQLVTQWSESHPERFPAWLSLGFTTGVLGALTTFSTFGHETIRHLEKQEYLLGIGNVVLNVTLGLIAVAIGMWLAKSVAAQ